MSEAVFQAILRFTLKWEGGFQNSPNDPGNWTGGAVGSGRLVGTNFGISAASYPNIDIAGLTLGGATAIYRRDYWDAPGWGLLPDLIAFVGFDSGVNSGVGRAVGWLQAALGVTVDGVLGPQTRSAALGASDTQHVATKLLAERAFSDAQLGFPRDERVELVERAVALGQAMSVFANAPIGRTT